MGINFSRLLSLKYGNAVSNYLSSRYQAISVGRVMTCVLGMVVRREREIREFVKTPFYRVLENLNCRDTLLKESGEPHKAAVISNPPFYIRKMDLRERKQQRNWQNYCLPIPLCRRW